MATARFVAAKPRRKAAAAAVTTTRCAGGMQISQFIKLQRCQKMESWSTAVVDAKIHGNKKLLAAATDVNQVLAEVDACQCMLRGAETCSSASLCCCHGKYGRSCDLRCLCHGHCCNSLINTPELGIRESALGRELFTKTDLPLNKIAFVVCGNVLTTSDYEDCYEEMMLELGSQAAPSVYLYCIKVSWPGSAQGLPGDPHPDQYVIDHLDDMSGAANHSCDPNIAIQACWANNKVYAVGRTLRRIMLKEALTYDYKWMGVNRSSIYAELCFCCEPSCHGFIADIHSKFMEVSIQHYQKMITTLAAEHATTEKTLEDRQQSLEIATYSGLDVEEYEKILFRHEIENARLKVEIDNIHTAIAKAILAVPKIVIPPPTPPAAVALVEEPRTKEMVKFKLHFRIPKKLAGSFLSNLFCSCCCCRDTNNNVRNECLEDKCNKSTQFSPALRALCNDHQSDSPSCYNCFFLLFIIQSLAFCEQKKKYDQPPIAQFNPNWFVKLPPTFYSPAISKQAKLQDNFVESYSYIRLERNWKSSSQALSCNDKNINFQIKKDHMKTEHLAQTSYMEQTHVESHMYSHRSDGCKSGFADCSSQLNEFTKLCIPQLSIHPFFDQSCQTQCNIQT